MNTYHQQIKNFLRIVHKQFINRGSYTSAYVFLNLLKVLRKRDKMRGLPSILSHSQQV